MKMRAMKDTILDFGSFIDLSKSLDSKPCDSILAVKIVNHIGSELQINGKYEAMFPNEVHDYPEFEYLDTSMSRLQLAIRLPEGFVQSFEVKEIQFIDGAHFKVNGLNVMCESDHQSGEVFPMLETAPDIQCGSQVFGYELPSDMQRALSIVTNDLEGVELQIVSNVLGIDDGVRKNLDTALLDIKTDPDLGREIFNRAVTNLESIFQYESLSEPVETVGYNRNQLPKPR